MDICTDYENVGNYPKNGCAGKVREVGIFKFYIDTRRSPDPPIDNYIIIETKVFALLVLARNSLWRNTPRRI